MGKYNEEVSPAHGLRLLASGVSLQKNLSETELEGLLIPLLVLELQSFCDECGSWRLRYQAAMYFMYEA